MVGGTRNQEHSHNLEHSTLSSMCSAPFFYISEILVMGNLSLQYEFKNSAEIKSICQFGVN